MVDPAQRKAPVIDAQSDVAVSPRWRLVAIGAAAALLIGGVLWIWLAVREGQTADRWERLHEIEEGFEDSSRFPYSDPWPTVQAAPSDVDSRDRHVQKLEEFLAKEGSDPAIAAHVHALLADLELNQVLSMSGTTTEEALKPHYDAAKKHLETLIKDYPEAPITQSRFSPRGGERSSSSAGYKSIASLLLARLEENREWGAKHGLHAVEPDAEPLVVLRTTEGDLRLRLFASVSPNLAKSFLDRACKGDLDGTYLFEKETSAVRGGDVRARRTHKGEDPTPEERMKWGAPSAGDPLVPERGRDAVLHVKGVVSAWHPGVGEELDDPYQFVVLTADDPTLDFRFTPFAKVEGVDSMNVLERLASVKTRAAERREKNAADVDPKFAKIATQFAKPVEIVKALVYEKGELASCVAAARADESEKKLSTLKLDAYRVIPPPEPAPSTSPPKKSEEPAKDGAAMEAPMDGAPPEPSPAPTPPAMTDAPSPK
jgi:cyclophilin family peptidyl-prolyl cis-trans isomerase